MKELSQVVYDYVIKKVKLTEKGYLVMLGSIKNPDY